MQRKSLSRTRLFVTQWTVHGVLQAGMLEWAAVPFCRGSSQSRDGTQVFHIAAEPQGKPKNTGVGSLSLLQWIFLTQELNQGLLHCRQIPYQLSYEGAGPCWVSILNTAVCTCLPQTPYLSLSPTFPLEVWSLSL